MHSYEEFHMLFIVALVYYSLSPIIRVPNSSEIQKKIFTRNSIGSGGWGKVKSTERTQDTEMTLETQIKNKETGSIINSITAQSNENIRDTLSYL